MRLAPAAGRGRMRDPACHPSHPFAPHPFALGAAANRTSDWGLSALRDSGKLDARRPLTASGWALDDRQTYTSPDGRSARKECGSGVLFEVPHVWCPKYRRSVLTPPVDGRLKVLLAEIADEHGMTIHAAEVMPDHVHLFVEADPTLCVAEVVNRLKGRTSGLLRQEFPALRSRLPTLWSRSDFAARSVSCRKRRSAATSPRRRAPECCGPSSTGCTQPKRRARL